MRLSLILLMAVFILSVLASGCDQLGCDGCDCEGMGCDSKEDNLTTSATGEAEPTSSSSSPIPEEPDSNL